MPKFEVINSYWNKTGTKFLDLFRLTDSFGNFKLRLVQFSLIVIRSAKRYFSEREVRFRLRLRRLQSQ